MAPYADADRLPRQLSTDGVHQTRTRSSRISDGSSAISFDRAHISPQTGGSRGGVCLKIWVLTEGSEAGVGPVAPGRQCIGLVTSTGGPVDQDQVNRICPKAGVSSRLRERLGSWPRTRCG